MILFRQATWFLSIPDFTIGSTSGNRISAIFRFAWIFLWWNADGKTPAITSRIFQKWWCDHVWFSLNFLGNASEVLPKKEIKFVSYLWEITLNKFSLTKWRRQTALFLIKINNNTGSGLYLKYKFKLNF